MIATSFLSCTNGSQSSSDLPNIIFIITDDQQCGLTSIEGNPISKTPNIFDAIKPIRSNISLEQIKKEQNYKPISYKEFRKIADELALEEPIEELLALLTK